jgi:hypothetical protein
MMYPWGRSRGVDTGVSGSCTGGRSERYHQHHQAVTPGPHFLFLSELTCYSVMVNPIAIQEFWDLSIHPIHFAALSFGLQSQALLCHPSMLTLNSCFHLQLKHFYRSILVHLRIQEKIFNLQPNPTSEVYVRSQKKASKQ